MNTYTSTHYSNKIFFFFLTKNYFGLKSSLDNAGHLLCFPKNWEEKMTILSPYYSFDRVTKYKTTFFLRVYIYTNVYQHTYIYVKYKICMKINRYN